MPNDPLDTVRGISNGLALSALLWAFAIACYWGPRLLK